MNARPFLLAALALAMLAGTACSTIVGGDTLSDAQQVIANMKIGLSDLTIVGAVDRADRRYRVGEPIVLTAQVNRAASVAVLRVMPSGATTLVFPNRGRATANQAGNSPLRIPITAGAPGVALFEFIASSRGGSWLFSRRPQGSADFAELGATTRALASDIVASLRAGQGTDSAASHVVVRVDQ